MVSRLALGRTVMGRCTYLQVHAASASASAVPQCSHDGRLRCSTEKALDDAALSSAMALSSMRWATAPDLKR